jgi:hypothetical protein
MNFVKYLLMGIVYAAAILLAILGVVGLVLNHYLR